MDQSSAKAEDGMSQKEEPMPQKGKRLDTMRDGFENTDNRAGKTSRCLIRAPGRGAQN